MKMLAVAARFGHDAGRARIWARNGSMRSAGDLFAGAAELFDVADQGGG